MIRAFAISSAIILSGILPGIQAQVQTTGSSRVDPAERMGYYIGFTTPQKVYLHLNKANYNAGETIWFRAYLFDGVTHRPDTATANLIVELIRDNGALMERRLLLVEKGVAEGDIMLSRELPDGNYMIRAYTDWMRNFDEDFFYTGHFYIRNDSYANIIPRSEVRVNRRYNRRYQNLQVENNIAFFPEGGNLVYSLPGRVAFKAYDGLGRGVDVSGTVVDNNSRVVAEFESVHSGMGSFDFIPESGRSYTARVIFRNGEAAEYRVPLPVESGAVIRTDQDESYVTTQIFSSGPAASGPMTLIAHTRGEIVSINEIRTESDADQVRIPRTNFPSGIAHFTLFSPDMQPVAERLVFINHNDAFVFYPGVKRQTVGNQEYYVVEIEVNDDEGNPVEGNFSISVLQSPKGLPAPGGNIVRHLLMSSDLKGYTGENYELESNNANLHADLIMMTHGWRRFTWEDVLATRIPEIRYLPEAGITIAGEAFDRTRAQMLANFPVEMLVMDQEPKRYSTYTNQEGVFVFDSLVFYDNIRIRIFSERMVTSGHPPLLEMRTPDPRDSEYQAGSLTLPLRITSRGDAWRRVAGAGESQYAQSIREEQTQHQYGAPDQTIYIERDTRQNRMYDILVSRVRGLNHNLQFTGPTSLMLSSEPLFMLDGSQVAQSAFLALDPRYVQRIEVFSGSRASIFGVRGANGVILGYTRRAGDPEITDYKEYLVQGYHSPREYYTDLVAPRAEDGQHPGIHRSIFWKPDIRTNGEGLFAISFPFIAGSEQLTFVIEGAGTETGFGAGTFSIVSEK